MAGPAFLVPAASCGIAICSQEGGDALALLICQRRGFGEAALNGCLEIRGT